MTDQSYDNNDFNADLGDDQNGSVQSETTDFGSDQSATPFNGSVQSETSVRFHPEMEEVQLSPSVGFESANQRPTKSPEGNKNSTRNYVSVGLLFVVNLLNYMDRYTVAALLKDIQQHFDINDTIAGLLQTVFIIAYLIFAPLCGYLGDRFNRKLIISVGIVIWSLAVLASSFVPSNLVAVFFFLRALVGVGEASYSNVAPTILADMFTKDALAKCLMIFYFAIPVGSGLGFVVGSQVGAHFGWQWGIRVTPIITAVLLVAIILLVREPVRGESVGSAKGLEAKSYKEDLATLATNKTYIWVTMGSTCLAFVTGSLGFWIPSMAIYGVLSTGIYTEGADIGLYFGAVSAVGGLVGVVMGSLIAQKWRRSNPKADPLVCGIGLLVSVPFGYVALNLIRINIYVVWPVLLIAMISLSLNWAVINDILMYIVIPTRRATAISMQTMLLHLFGDAASPFIIGAVSVRLQNGIDSDFRHFISLKYSMFVQFFVMILGGFLFLGSSWFVVQDKLKAAKEAKAMLEKEGVVATVGLQDSADFRWEKPVDPEKEIVQAQLEYSFNQANQSVRL